MWRTIKRAWPLLAVAATLLGMGVLWWISVTSRHGPRDFQGLLVYNGQAMGIPEDPPPPAYLVTPRGTYELHVPNHAVSRLLHRLKDLDGKQVIIRGEWGIRPTLAGKHEAIVVDDVRLNAPATAPTTLPSQALPGGTGSAV